MSSRRMNVYRAYSTPKRPRGMNLYYEGVNILYFVIGLVSVSTDQSRYDDVCLVY